MVLAWRCRLHIHLGELCCVMFEFCYVIFFSFAIKIFKGRFLKMSVFPFLGAHFSAYVEPRYTTLPSFTHSIVMKTSTHGFIYKLFLARFMGHFTWKSWRK